MKICGHAECGGHGVESQEHGTKESAIEANGFRNGGGADSSVESRNGGIATGNRDYGMGVCMHDAGMLDKCDLFFLR